MTCAECAGPVDIALDIPLWSDDAVEVVGYLCRNCLYRYLMIGHYEVPQEERLN